MQKAAFHTDASETAKGSDKQRSEPDEKALKKLNVKASLLVLQAFPVLLLWSISCFQSTLI